jgi:TPR repeat protein
MPDVRCQCHLELQSQEPSMMDSGPSQVNMRLASAWRCEHGASRDAEAALREYKAAEQLGSSYAANRIGMIVLEGRTIVADAFHAANWFRHAAVCGSAEGLHNLGSCYEMGVGIACDTQVAEVLYAEAAAAGCTDAMLKLACLHLQVRPGGLATAMPSITSVLAK